jgi:hypothetical protein
MNKETQPAATSLNAAMRSEIAQKWGKFSASEIAGFKNNDDLVAQVQSKYGLEKAQAQRDVDAFAKGRRL